MELFGPDGWESRDHFGSREAGEGAAYEATPEEWRILFCFGLGLLIEEARSRGRALGVTSQDITALTGWPPGHRSRVGANMLPAARAFGLVKKGTRKALGRHQHYNTVWGWPDEKGVEVDTSDW